MHFNFCRTTYESSEELAEHVAQDKNAIGFNGFAYIGNTKAISVDGGCGIALKPNMFSVKTEEYPLARRLYLYTIGESRNKQAKQFLNYTLSTSAQSIIRKNGFINHNVILLDSSKQGIRWINASIDDNLKKLSGKEQEMGGNYLKDFLLTIKTASRISITFRFEKGSHDLDNKSLSDLERLADFMKKEKYKNNKLMLLGFSDNVGSFNKNLKLSKERAESVRKTLETQGISVELTKGYGELAPVACNQGKGLEINRRVEVWLK